MLTFAEDDDEYGEDIEINYAAKVKGLTKEKARDIHFLNMNEVMVIYNTLKEKKKYQQALLCALLIDSAGRRQEVYQVLKNSITKEANFTNEVIGKRGKKFRLFYNDLTLEANDLYMKDRGEDDIDSLWITKQDGVIKKASYESLYSWVVSWRKILKDELNIDKDFNPHSFRHSSLERLNTGEHYIAKKLNKKFSILELKVYAHHESVDTTSNYLINKDEEMLLEAFGIS